jgi:hypothetical protein
VEGNFIVNNWPPSLFPASGFTDASTLNFYDEVSVNGIISLRGNRLINNFPAPVSPDKLSGADNFLTDFYLPVLLDSTQGVNPVLDTNSTTASRLVGTVPLANTNAWPTTVIDLYAADTVGITNGQAAGLADLPFGFVQGRAYLASFTDNGPADRDNRPGHFDFDISAVDTQGSLITVTANYVSTNAAVVMTSPFSAPATIVYSPQIQFGPVTLGNGNVVLTWTGGTGPFTVQLKATLNDATWQTATNTPSRTATLPMTNPAAFFRIKQ